MPKITLSFTQVECFVQRISIPRGGIVAWMKMQIWLKGDADVFHIFAHLKFAHGFASSVTRRSLIF